MRPFGVQIFSPNKMKVLANVQIIWTRGIHNLNQLARVQLPTVKWLLPLRTKNLLNSLISWQPDCISWLPLYVWKIELEIAKQNCRFAVNGQNSVSATRRTLWPRFQRDACTPIGRYLSCKLLFAGKAIVRRMVTFLSESGFVSHHGIGVRRQNNKTALFIRALENLKRILILREWKSMPTEQELILRKTINLANNRQRLKDRLF